MRGIPENCAYGIRNLGLESGIQLKESGIPLTIGIQNPSSTDKYWNPVTWNPESTVWNPESKTFLDSIKRGEINV